LTGPLDVESEVREALHDIFARFFEKIAEATGGVIEVEDLTVGTFSISISVTLKPRERPKEETLKKSRSCIGGH